MHSLFEQVPSSSLLIFWENPAVSRYRSAKESQHAAKFQKTLMTKVGISSLDVPGRKCWDQRLGSVGYNPKE